MNKLLYILLFITINLFSNEHINLTQKDIETIDILDKSQIYIDKTKKLTFDEMRNKKNQFEKNTKNVLSYGFDPNFNVWIHFTITNKSNKPIKKLLEYANPLTSYVNLYEISDKEINTQKEGSFQITKDRRALNPIFEINLEPNETKEYYISATSEITTLIIRLRLWEAKEFYNKEIKYHFALAIFFGAMAILLFYNLFIYYITKDRSYFYYIIYVFGVSTHHLLYTGVSSVYILSQDLIIASASYAVVFIAIPIYGATLFVKEFLDTKQYPIWNKIINSFIIGIPIFVIVVLIFDLNKIRSFIFIICFIFLVTFTIYAAYKKNKQAYYILFGWIAILFSFLIMFLSSAGILTTHQYFPYIAEPGILLDAVIFSIALAAKIKDLEAKNLHASLKLLKIKANEEKRLHNLVESQTKDIKKALQDKDILLKELNHRVKNNMQIIISLIRLQKDKIEDENITEILTTIQNRINAMSQLHQLLYIKNEDLVDIIPTEYFEKIVSEIINSSSANKINIKYNIKSKLRIGDLLYCGLIVNELVTNSIKYAFDDNSGEIFINLIKKETEYILTISDNGKGYKDDANNDSFGLLLIKTLVDVNLQGDMNVLNKNGTTTIIRWS